MVDPDFEKADQAEPLREKPPIYEKPEVPLPLSKPAAENHCPKCRSPKMIPDVWIVDQQGEYSDDKLTVRIDRDPDAWFAKGTAQVELRATIYGACGYTELYATKPSTLWQVYQDRRRKGG